MHSLLLLLGLFFSFVAFFVANMPFTGHALSVYDDE